MSRFDDLIDDCFSQDLKHKIEELPHIYECEVELLQGNIVGVHLNLHLGHANMCVRMYEDPTNCGLASLHYLSHRWDLIPIQDEVAQVAAKHLRVGMLVASHNQHYPFKAWEELGWVVSSPAENPNEGHDIYIMTKAVCYDRPIYTDW